MKISKEEFREFAQALWGILKEEPQNASEVPPTMRGAVQSLRLFLGMDRLNPLVANTEEIVEQLATQPGPRIMTGQSGWQTDENTGRMRFDQISNTPGKLAAQNLRNFSSVWGSSDLVVQPDHE